MKRNYKRRLKRKQDGSRLGVKFGGEVTLGRFKRSQVIRSCVRIRSENPAGFTGEGKR